MLVVSGGAEPRPYIRLSPPPPFIRPWRLSPPHPSRPVGPCHLLPKEKAGWDLPPCAIQLTLPAAVTGFGRSRAPPLHTVIVPAAFYQPSAFIVAGLRAIRESPLRYSCPFLRRAGLPQGHWLHIPLMLRGVSLALCVPPCPVAVSHASSPHNAAPPPGWPGGGDFFVFAFHARWRSKLPVVDTPSSTMTKAWGSISAMAWRREAISYLFRHTHSTCTGLSVKPP